MPTHPFLVALRPVAKALGASIVPAAHACRTPTSRCTGKARSWAGCACPICRTRWRRLIAGVEQQLGGELATLSREDKQRAVRMLEERGAFQIRKSIEDTADALGVSRITVYNYLNAIRDPSGAGAPRADGRAS